MRYFLGVWKSSVRNHPPMGAGLVEGLYSSMVSYGGGTSLCASTSLTTTGTKTGGAGSAWPGEPLSVPLGRQLDFKPHVSRGAFSSAIASENPKPSVMG